MFRAARVDDLCNNVYSHAHMCTHDSIDHNKVVEPKSGGAPPYENIEISTSTSATTTEESNKYEHVELPGAEHESTVKYEKTLH